MGIRVDLSQSWICAKYLTLEQKKKKQILWIFLSVAKALSNLLSLTPHLQLVSQ